MAKYLSKIADFNLLHLHLVPRSNSAKILASETEVAGLPCGVVCVILRLAVFIELRLVTDRRTDTATSMYRASKRLNIL